MSDLTRISQLLVDKLIAKGGRELFETKQFREQACRFVRDYGCPRPMDQAVVWALGGLMSYGIGLGAGKVEQWLYRLVERLPPLRAAFEKLVQIAQRCQDESELKSKLIEAMQSSPTIDMDASMQSSLDVVQALFSASQFERLSQELKEGLGGLRSAINDRFEGFDDLELHDPAFRRVVSGAAARLDYRSEAERFVGRGDEFDALANFLGDKSKIVEANRVLWRAISGPAGVGKSRFALECMRFAQATGWRAGFVTIGELARLHDRSWRPRWDTLIIVDSVGDSVHLVSAFLYYCATRAVDFEFAVRVLIVERDESSQLERLTPVSSEGRVVLSAREGPALFLDALPVETIFALMVERAARLSLPDISPDVAVQMVTGTGARDGRAPARANALYALAAVERLALAYEADPNVDVSALSWAAESIFSEILEEEKETRWCDPGRRGGQHDNIVELHANLLWFATFVGGLNAADRAVFEQCANLLPGIELRDALPVERARYIRMAGGEPRHRFEPLKPDLLGEYFIMSRVRELNPEDARDLLQAAYAHGGRAEEIFQNCAFDFPELWRRVGRLHIETQSSSASTTYLNSVTGTLQRLKNLDRANDIKSLWDDVKPHVDARAHDEMPAKGMQTIIAQVDLRNPDENDGGSLVFPGFVESVHSFSDDADENQADETNPTPSQAGRDDGVDTFQSAFAALMNFASVGDEAVSFEALIRAARLMGPLTSGEAVVHLIRLSANYFSKAPPDMSMPILRRLTGFFDPSTPRVTAALFAAGRNLAVTQTAEVANGVLVELRPILEQVNVTEANERAAAIILHVAGQDKEKSGRLLSWLRPLAERHDDIHLLITAAKLAFNLTDHHAHPADDPYWDFVRDIVVNRKGGQDSQLEHAWAQSELVRAGAVTSRPGPKRFADILAIIYALGHMAITYARQGDFSQAIVYRVRRAQLTKSLKQDSDYRALGEGLERGLDDALANLGVDLH